MGVSRRRKHSRRARIRRDHVYEIIAYLDYCLMRKPDHEYFKKTVTAHLEKTTGKTYLFEQIDIEIKKLWNDADTKSAEYYDHQSIYHYGSKLLPCVQNDAELEGRVQMRVEEIWREKFFEYVELGGRTRRSKATEHHIVLGHDLDFMKPARTPRKVFQEISPGRHEEEKSNEAEQLQVSFTVSLTIYLL